ncbi:hypothetical protein [Desertivirga brevis]|uniref:hypothetical protein n=1 Tax=Desertivirga brevis TaxID=2810310 RepID=UPI001A95C589|nr:hypothetical protein [Pedobacter sp. SYSU D00873]
MLRQTLSLLVFTITLSFNLIAQDLDSISSEIKLDFPIVDAPYLNYASQTVNGGERKPGSFLKSYANPSMHQSLAITTDVYTAVHYGIKNGLNKLPNTSRLKKRLSWSAHYLADFILMYSPLGGGWLHEEFHRSVMTVGRVNSFNDMNKFPIGATTVAVSHVEDGDLVRFKAADPRSFIRMQVAGIEGEYLMIDRLQRSNFFSQQKLPFEAQYILTTLNSALYVLACSNSKIADAETAAMNKREGDVEVRDFTGLDFNGWAYDLFRPEEPYTARGVHPSGVGIDRYRTTNDLEPQQLDYLKTQGKLQFLNFLSPMMFGVRSITLGKTGLKGNFAVRHLLTSFGNDISLNVYLMNQWHRASFSYHRYQNYNKGFSSIEGLLKDEPVDLTNRTKLLFTPRVILGMQPLGQDFMTRKSSFLGFASLRTVLDYLSTKWSPYLELDAKTPGWVAGNEFLGQKLTARLGLEVQLK